MERTECLDRLKRLPLAAFERVILALDVLQAELPSPLAAQQQRAIELIRIIEGRGPAAFEQLSAELLRAEQHPGDAEASHPIDTALDDVKQLLEEHLYELAQKSLERLELRWPDISPGRQARLLAQKGYSHFARGDLTAAAREHLRAGKISPGNERTRINEAIAYELLGDTSRAHQLAEVLVRDFPYANRAFALWLRTAPLECSAESQEQKVQGRLFPPDAEVWLAVSSRAIVQRDFARAERLARLATEMDAAWSSSWLTLGHAIAQSIAPKGSSHRIALSEEQKQRLRQAIEAFEKASELAGKERLLPIQVEALACCAQTHDLLDEADATETLLREANRQKPNDARLLFFLGSFLREQRRYQEAVPELEHSLQLKSRPKTKFALALALSSRRRDGDLRRAVDLFAQVAHETSHELAADALKFAINGYLTDQRFDEASRLLDQLASDSAAPVFRQTLRGLVLLAADKKEEAVAQAEAALRAWTTDCPPLETETLASLLTQLKRYAEALPLWQAIFDPESPGHETNGLLACAHHLHRDDVLLATCRRLREARKASSEVEKYEIALLARYDPTLAISVLTNYLDNHPNDFVGRLALFSCQLRTGLIDSVNFPLEHLPPAKDVDPIHGRMIVHLLREHGRAVDAREYGYQLVRWHYGSVDAHRAFCLSFLPDRSDDPQRNISLPLIIPGASVAYVEENNTDVQWFIISDVPEARLELQEYSPSDPWSVVFIGKSVGDKVRLPGSGPSGRLAQIKAIQTKYAHRLRDSMKQMTESFAAISGWAAIHTPKISNPDIDPETALKPLLDHLTLAAHQEHLTFEKYRNYPISIQAFAGISGQDVFEAQLSLIRKDSIEIRCWDGSPTLEQAGQWLETNAIEIVVDLTALVTLFALDKLYLLSTWGVTCIVSQATLEELRNEVRKNRPNPHQLGSLVSSGTMHHYLEHSTEHAQNQYSSYSRLLETVLACCQVQGGLPLASVTPEERKLLLNCFGRHGAESLALARARNALLWTDDAIISLFATRQWGIRRVWTYAVLHSLSKVIGQKILIDCTAKLVGWEYTRTDFNLSVLIHAAEMNGWQPSARPLKQIIKVFADESSNLLACINALGLLILEVEQQAIVNPSAQATYRVILESLRSRPGGTLELRKMIAGLPEIIRLRIRRTGPLAIGGPG